MTELAVIDPNLDDAADAWAWLHDHPYFWFKPYDDPRERYSYESGFTEALTIMVVKVNPDTGRIDSDRSLNTSTRVWLECGPWLEAGDVDALKFTGQACHDTHLDCGAPTFEEAVTKLATLVFAREGSYVERRLCSHCLRSRPAGSTDDNVSWYCSAECLQHRGFDDLHTKAVPGKESRQFIPPEAYCPCSYHGAAPHACDTNEHGECSVCGTSCRSST